MTGLGSPFSSLISIHLRNKVWKTQRVVHSFPVW